MPVKTRSMIKKEQEMQQMQQELQQNEPDVYADAKKMYDECKTLVLDTTLQFAIDFTGDIMYDAFEGFSDDDINHNRRIIIRRTSKLMKLVEKLKQSKTNQTACKDLVIDVIILVYKYVEYTFISTNSLQVYYNKENELLDCKNLLIKTIDKIKEFKTSIPKHYSKAQKNKLFNAMDEYIYRIVNYI